jgi:hypothetical protein
MLAMVGGHHLVTENDAALTEGTLEAAVSGPSPEPTPDSEALLAQWSTERQMAHLMSSLGFGAATNSPRDQGRRLRESDIGMAQR